MIEPDITHQPTGLPVEVYTGANLPPKQHHCAPRWAPDTSHHRSLPAIGRPGHPDQDVTATRRCPTTGNAGPLPVYP
jgi:hypothetical protein